MQLLAAVSNRPGAVLQQVQETLMTCATVLLLVLRFASNTVSRLASADLCSSVTIWDIDMEERDDNKLTETFIVKFSFNGPDGE